MACFVVSIVLAALYSIVFFRFLSWRNSMIRAGRWKYWNEVAKELDQGNGLLYVDCYGKGMTIWWLPKFPAEEGLDEKNSEHDRWLPTDGGFATYCPFWLRFHFIFRRRFPKAKLITSGYYTSFS